MMKLMRPKLQGWGYTIIELMIVLSVTGFLLVAASVLLRGQTTETGFQQTTHDIESKIRTVVSGVSNGLFPNASQYKCDLEGNPVPVATLHKESGGGLGSNDDCIMLGRAIKVTTDKSLLNIYTVLGSRTYLDPDDGKLKPVTNLQQALPTPALSDTADLTENYAPIANAARLKSATYVDINDHTVSSPQVQLAGFYLDPKGSSTNQSEILAKGYQTNGQVSNDQITVCLSEQSPALSLSGTVACDKAVIKHWLLCYQDSAGSKTAQIDVVVSATGVTTRLNETKC